MKTRSIHRLDALHLLKDGREHKLRLWKLSTGDILTYNRAQLIGRHERGGLSRLRLLPSGEIRAVRDVCIFEIDDLSIFL